jgi:hypothetical protein
MRLYLKNNQSKKGLGVGSQMTDHLPSKQFKGIFKSSSLSLFFSQLLIISIEFLPQLYNVFLISAYKILFWPFPTY